MSRLIDADELLEHVWRDRLDSRELIAKMIESAPTVKPKPGVGKWINVRGGNIADCDQCGSIGRAWMNFCPICGADMREGEVGYMLSVASKQKTR